MSLEHCPRCGAGLRIETRGPLLDKVQACKHCDFEHDILDEVTMEEEEAGKRVKIHRKDLGSQDVKEHMLGDAALQAKVRAATGMDMADLLSNASSLGGKTISQTTTTSQSFSGDEARQKMAEMGFDFDQVLSDSKVRASQDPGSTETERKWMGWILLVLLLGGLVALGWSLSS